MKKTLSLILIIVILTTLSGCIEDDSNAPYKFPLSKWQTRDKSITMYVGSDGTGYGDFTINDKKVEIYYNYYLEVKIFCYNKNDYWKNGTVDTLEVWETKCDEKNIFITVSETTYFEVGQEIVLELVDANVDESEIPYPSKPEILPETSDYDFPYPEN